MIAERALTAWWARSDVASWHRVGADGRRCLCGALIGEGFARSDAEMTQNAHTSERCARCEAASVRPLGDEIEPDSLVSERRALRKAAARAAWALSEFHVKRLGPDAELGRQTLLRAAEGLGEAYAVLRFELDSAAALVGVEVAA